MAWDKRSEEKVVKAVVSTGAFIVVLLLAGIIGGIIWKGLPALSWEMVSQVPKGGYYFGKEGGVFNAIVGSIYLALGASVLAGIISVAVAVYMHTYLRPNHRAQRRIRLALDVLWGVPAIVYGAFGFSLMLLFGWQASLLAAIITVALLISPVMIRALDESFQNTPVGLYEAALSLGFFRGEAGRFLLRKCLPGFGTAFLLALGKGIGDTASVLFTAGYTDYVPESLMEPSATLPLAVFFQLSSPIPEVKARAYAAALILTVIILVISISSRFIAKRLAKD